MLERLSFPPLKCLRISVENHFTICVCVNLYFRTLYSVPLTCVSVYTVLCLVSHVQLFATPWTIARQTPLSMGFSRSEYWSGVPCPPPGGLPSPGVRSRFPALQADSLPPEPPGKPRNAGVGSLTLLQGVFPAQGSDPGFLHCRWILYHLSHQGSPRTLEWAA